MSEVQESLRAFLATVLLVWVAALIGLSVYFQQQHIPRNVQYGVAAAFCAEAALFLAIGFESVRERLPRGWKLASLMAVTGILPYLLAGFFNWQSFWLLCVLVALVCFWFLLLPRSLGADSGFLALLGLVILWRMFGHIYGDPLPKLPLSILGELMWTRLFILAALLIRGVDGTGFGFIPRREDLRIGLRHYLYFLPLGLLLNLQIDFVDPRQAPLAWWKLALTISSNVLGMYIFVALREEFIFRGLLQQWLSQWWRSRRAGLLAASLIFGLAHLPFRQWPNWKFALLAVLAGWFYGRAFQQAGGIRAAMVTHALVNTTWRTLMQ